MLQRLRRVFTDRVADHGDGAEPNDPWKTSAFALVNSLQLIEEQDFQDLGRFLEGMRALMAAGCRPTSQLGQEALALGFNPSGPQVFIECGAAGPRYLSNTFHLQHSFSWRGLLIEPNPDFVVELSERVTQEVKVVPAAAGSRGKIELVCAEEVSTAVDYINVDGHAPERRAAFADGRTWMVDRVPLSDMLDEFLPDEQSIGLITVDVEGAELDVLQSLDWRRWRPRVVAVEHNHRQPYEAQLDSLMFDRGYRRILARFSDWDAWYVLQGGK